MIFKIADFLITRDIISADGFVYNLLLEIDARFFPVDLSWNYWHEK